MPDAKIRYVVIGEAAIVNTVDGTSSLVVKNGPVPTNVDPEHLKHLLAVGLVGDVDGEFTGGLPVVYAGDGTDLVPVVPAPADPPPAKPASRGK